MAAENRNRQRAARRAARQYLDSRDAARRAARRRMYQPRDPVRAARRAQRHDELRHHFDRPADGQRVARAAVRSPAAALALVPSTPRSGRPDGANHLRHVLDSNDRDERFLPVAVVTDSAGRDVRRDDQDGRDVDARRARDHSDADFADHVDQRAHRRDRRRRADQGEPPLHRRAERACGDSRRAGVHARGRVVPRVRRVEQCESRRHAPPLHSADSLRRRGWCADRMRHGARDLPRCAARSRRPPHYRRPYRLHHLPRLALRTGESDRADLRTNRRRQSRPSPMPRVASHRSRYQGSTERADAGPRARRNRIRQRGIRLRAGAHRAQGDQLQSGARGDDRDRRPKRLRKNHNGQSARALLRAAEWRDQD